MNGQLVALIAIYLLGIVFYSIFVFAKKINAGVLVFIYFVILWPITGIIRIIAESELVQGNLPPFKESLRLLRDLADIQNGPPLVRHEKEYNEIMEKVYAFLNTHENKSPKDGNSEMPKTAADVYKEAEDYEMDLMIKSVSESK